MDMDKAYANGAFIAGADAYSPRWQARAAAFRAALGPRARLNIPYGPAPRQQFDLFMPGTVATGCLVFVHGGYWLGSGRQDWSHLAAGAVARGWACAMPSYTLAPQARIAAMTVEIAAAVGAVAQSVTGPLIITGHSAGGHLAARMGCADQTFAAAHRIARVVPISALADLQPLRATTMNGTLHLDAAEASRESPVNHTLRPGVAAHVWVGGQERPSFVWQARSLSEAWSCAWTVAPGKHHFNVIDDLETPDSALLQTLIGGL